MIYNSCFTHQGSSTTQWVITSQSESRQRAQQEIKEKGNLNFRSHLNHRFFSTWFRQWLWKWAESKHSLKQRGASWSRADVSVNEQSFSLTLCTLMRFETPLKQPVHNLLVEASFSKHVRTIDDHQWCLDSKSLNCPIVSCHSLITEGRVDLRVQENVSK